MAPGFMMTDAVEARVAVPIGPVVRREFALDEWPATVTLGHCQVKQSLENHILSLGPSAASRACEPPSFRNGRKYAQPAFHGIAFGEAAAQTRKIVKHPPDRNLVEFRQARERYVPQIVPNADENHPMARLWNAVLFRGDYVITDFNSVR